MGRCGKLPFELVDISIAACTEVSGLDMDPFLLSIRRFTQ
jgi:hypothetical protein